MPPKFGLRHSRIVHDDPPVVVSPSTALAMPAGFSTGSLVASCADLYDTFGVNVHGRDGGTPTIANPTLAVQRIRELGFRHVRDGLIDSWNDFGWSNIYFGLYRTLRLHNAAVPAGEQPVFLTTIHNGYQPDLPPYTNAPLETVADHWAAVDGGHQHYTPQVVGTTGIGNPIPNGATTNPSSVPANWAFSDPELALSIIGCFGAPNEPALNKPANTSEIWSIIMPGISQGKLDPSRSTRVAFGGLAVPCNDGTVQTNCKLSQIPVHGPQSMAGGSTGDWDDHWGDFTGRAGVTGETYRVDVGDIHPYQNGAMPSFERHNIEINGASLANGRLGYNGRLRTPKDTTKGIPMMATEIGYVQSLTALDSALGPGPPATRFSPNWDGYWPVPTAVAGEYMLRHFLVHYKSTTNTAYKTMGVRRTFIYDMFDDSNNDTSESRFGLCNNAGTPKMSYYVLRNFLKLIGFSWPTTLTYRPFTVSGFSSVGSQTQPAPNTSQMALPDRLDSFQLQQSNNQWIVVLFRQRHLWDYVNQAYITPDTQNVTVTLTGGGASSAQVGFPALGTDPTRTGGTTQDDGLSWNTATLSGGASVTVPISGYTKLIRFTF